MSSDEIARYRKLIAEAAGGFDPRKIQSHLIEPDGEGVNLSITVNTEFEPGVTITSINMYVHLCDDGDETYMDGDLGVTYDDETDNEQLVWHFYTDEAYNDSLTDWLEKSGFSSDAASQVSPTEAGMQDYGRISYDAHGVAAEVRKALFADPNTQIAMDIGAMMLKHMQIDVKASDIEDRKTNIIKRFLKRAKSCGKVPLDVLLPANVMKHAGIQWPELDTLLRSAGQS